MDSAPWHILLIEDNPEDCADMRQMLLHAGTRRYRFSEARFGAEGVRKVLAQEHGPVDCVLLDYALPDMDALDVLAALNNGADMPPCAVVVITGAAVEEGRALLSAGAQDFIGKRWTSADSLTRAVDNAVDRYGLQLERRRVEGALRASEERYRALFNSIDAGYAVMEVILDDVGAPVDARYLQVNPAFARQTDMQHAVGHTLCSLVPDIEFFWIDAFGKVALTGEPVRLEQYSAALRRWFDIYAFRLGAPQALQVAVLFNDTTERKRNESALIAAKAEADTANRAKSNFLLNMSHELRSPLSSILGFTQLIAGGKPPPSPAQQDSVEQILHAGWYLLGLVNEILDLSAIESGKTVLAPRPMEMADVLADCRAMVAPQAQLSGIELAFPVLPQAFLVQADPVRTKQVLINLLTNAIKYNRPAGRVEVRCAAAPGQRVRVSVEDTGQGLSAAQLGQLFDPFNRLGQERGTQPGTGIGLVICKRLVELMGGRIGAESTPGDGSCFWFELDAASAPAAREQPLRSVLCIDEDAARLQHVDEVLALYPGSCLLRAHDIDSGMHIARLARPDVILLGLHARDLADPGGQGASLLLARDPATAHIPVIALGAGPDAPASEYPGFAAHLPQPLQPAALIQALERVCRPPRTGGQRATA